MSTHKSIICNSEESYCSGGLTPVVYTLNPRVKGARQVIFIHLYCNKHKSQRYVVQTSCLFVKWD